jgi:hypothetical protein
MFASRAAAEGGSDMKTYKLAGPHAFRLLVGIVALAVFAAGRTSWADGGQQFRWDLIHISSFSPNIVVFEGGHDSARANDCVPPGSSNCSKITLTGNGTFEVGDPENVTGGGTWETFDNTGASTGSGTYDVHRLIRFDVAPGTQTSTVIDHIGDGTLTDNRGGLAFLSIEYSDGSSGILVVSCHLNGGPGPASPPTIFEGITASKSFVDYWNREAPVNGIDGNRTLFHILTEGDNKQGD